MPPSIRQSVLSPVQPLKGQQKITWSRLYGSAKSLAISNFAIQQKKTLVLITVDNLSAINIVNELKVYLKGRNTPVTIFPDWETLPYDLFSPYQDITSERMHILFNMQRYEHGILVVPITTAMHRLLPKEYLLKNSLVLNVGQIIQLDEFKKQLSQYGYVFVEQVSEHGEVSVRGSLLDIFPMGTTSPFRIDFFDDEIDSIRTFDIDSQRSIDKVDSISVLPAHEVALTKEGISNFRTNWRSQFEGDPSRCSIYRDVSQFLAPAGIEYYLPLFYEKTNSLFDYMVNDSFLILDEGVEEAAESFWNDVNLRYEQRCNDIERPILPPRNIFLNTNDLFTNLKTFKQIQIENLALNKKSSFVEFASDMPIKLTINSQNKEPLKLVNDFIEKFNGRVLIASDTEGRRETIMGLFNGHNKPTKVDDWLTFLHGDIKFGIAIMPIEKGLIIYQPNITVITEAQLFGDRVQQRRLRKSKNQDAETIIRDLTELRVGSPVVHEDHGVGRYCGLLTLEVNGILSEFINLEYADGDKLYVPVSSLELIYRYTGVDPENAPLHKLGGGKWQKAKRKAKEKIYDVAAELLELHASRANRQGQSFSFDKDAYDIFVQQFPFEETQGQQQAIDSMIDDMCSVKPMDRLICGDAGFGKTEVAMRAAFIAVQNNKQVALLVPTTLLAQQHTQNFIDRFIDWPLRIETLSRFRKKKEQTATIEDMAAGKIDIIIGTHKLLQNDIVFKNLGLIIIDEEHRFGVRQKEKFKLLRTEVDILTLTATPIPRTLNMSLSEVRDLSIISTPPSRRLSVKTFVVEHSYDLLKEAVAREIKRGGQVFYLHNNVKTIEKVAEEMSNLLPEIRVCFAHGQMPEKQLESIMSDFYHHRFNLLVCTTIIETGIDIPKANTIIIDRADKFGLAQLYQLRGRVGRSHHRAYAYLIVPPRKLMTQDAIKRLEAIEALEELGVGFTLATHDLEIRGAGEILGEGQSGHIQEIGFSMYMDLLNRTVQAMKDGKMTNLNQPLHHNIEIDLHVSALIPEDFLPDVHIRLIMYKRIASAKSTLELDDLKEEMIDRFGLLPDAVLNLFKISTLKLLAKHSGVRKIDIGLNGGRIFFIEKANIDPIRVLKLIQSDPVCYKLDGQDKLRINIELPDIESRIQALKNIFDEIVVKDAA